MEYKSRAQIHAHNMKGVSWSKEDVCEAWNPCLPIIPQLWAMSANDYEETMKTPLMSGPSILMVGGSLERFTLSAWWHPMVTWVPLTLYLMLFSHSCGWPLSMVLFCAGWAFWTVLEYGLHRWVFHLDRWWPSKTLVGLRNVLAFAFHGIHHKYPGDPRRITTPLLLTAAIGTPIYIVLGACISHTDPFFAGAFAGYLFYDFTHYSYHIGPPDFLRGGWFKHLKTRHLHHHFKDDSRTFGVSVSFTDRLFGTMRPG